MKKYNLITPEGTRDLLFEECTARRGIEGRLMELFRSNGYFEVITPSLEFYDVFNGSLNREAQGFPQESMYKLTDSRGRLMVIRPDSTIPIIRLAETRLKDEPRPLKLCYNQTIYNVNPKEAGRDDEIAQCGIELIGEAESRDEDVLMLAVRVFKELGFDYRFEIGNCRLFERLVEVYGIAASEAEKIRKLVETKNYPELSAMEIPPAFAELPKLFGGKEVFAKAEELLELEKHGICLHELRKIHAKLEGYKITLDLGLTNTRGYYTGTLFNGYIAGLGKPVLSGGKYEISNTAAMGFAVDVSAIASLR
jgi:ATP phosphoribosyltransferase regulatory subunit